MRVTKKLLRTAVQGLQKRLKELTLMDDQQLRAEYLRCFPHADQEVFTINMRNYLYQDLIGLCIPSHWYE
jgi:hypothetical protein